MSPRSGCGHVEEILLCYREGDAADARSIFDHLTTHFGEKAVFMDVESVVPGTNWAQAIDERTRSCHVVIVLIGDAWRKNQGRLDDPNDRVRVEIKTAAARR